MNIDYLNPFSNNYQAANDLITHTSHQLKSPSLVARIKAVAMAMFITFLTFVISIPTLGFGATPAFRSMVNYAVTPKENAQQNDYDGTSKFLSAFDKQIQQIDLWASKILSQGKKLIYFYETGPVAFLGNFSPSQITVDGQTFACAEAAFQYKKYQLLADQHGISNSTNPLCQEFMAKLNGFVDPNCSGKKAFDINRELGGIEKYDFATKQSKIVKAGLVHQIAKLFNKESLYAKNWNKGIRDQVMWKILNVKFAYGNPNHLLLKATKDAYLLEHNNAKRDNYWSDNSDGSGENMLGRMLSAIRDGQPMPTGSKSNDFMDYVNLAIQNPHNYSIFKP